MGDKTGTKTGIAVMISPISGARTPTGAHPGNTGGKPGRSGRPPALLRQKLAGTLANRLQVVRDIADGVPMVKTRIALRDVLPHLTGVLHCSSCGADYIVSGNDAESGDIEITAVGSATPRDRLMALDLAGRYGLGAARDVNIENVRERMQRTLEIIRRRCPPELAVEIITAMRPIWL